MFDPFLLLINVCSLAHKTSEIEIDFQSVDNGYKFLCFTETWLSNDSINCFNFNNFSLSSYYCRNTFSHGGVGIWSRMGLNVCNIELKEFCIDKHIEICGVKWLDGDEIYIILVCYRSPTGDLILFYNGIYSVLSSLFTLSVKIILCGDINLDSYHPSKDFNDFKELLAIFGLEFINSLPTRVTNT